MASVAANLATSVSFHSCGASDGSGLDRGRCGEWTLSRLALLVAPWTSPSEEPRDLTGICDLWPEGGFCDEDDVDEVAELVLSRLDVSAAAFNLILASSKSALRRSISAAKSTIS